MGYVFKIGDPGKGIINIDTREPVLIDSESVEMTYPFAKATVNGVRESSTPEQITSTSQRLILGLKKVKGLRKFQIWGYRITLHVAELYAAAEVLEPVMGIITECWPEAQFKGYDYRGKNPLGAIAAELTAVPEYEVLVASMRDPKPNLSFEARRPHKLNEPIWIKGFRATSIHRQSEGVFVFYAEHNCFLTEHEDHNTLFSMSNDEYVFYAKLLIDLNKNEARLYLASNKP